MRPTFQKTLSFSVPRIPANKNTKEVTQSKTGMLPMSSNRAESYDVQKGNGANKSLVTAIEYIRI